MDIRDDDPTLRYPVLLRYLTSSLVASAGLAPFARPQGAFAEHSSFLSKLGGVDVREVRLPHEFEGLDGIVLPGTACNFDPSQPATFLGRWEHETCQTQRAGMEISTNRKIVVPLRGRHGMTYCTFLSRPHRTRALSNHVVSYATPHGYETADGFLEL